MPVDILIKQVPDDLKTWIAEEARRHHRSMNKETVVLLEAARARRASQPRDAGQDMDGLLARFRALPEIDRRSADEILGYDETGLPA